MNLLKACKIAYLKFHMGDPSITDSEATEVLMDALCNEIDSDNFCRFVDRNRKRIDLGQPFKRELLSPKKSEEA